MARVLIGCEKSGVVRRAFRALGHEAWSCDLEPADDESPYHLQGNVLDFLGPTIGGELWDCGIFHPPCTYILNSGVRWLYQGGKRFNKDGSENPKDLERWLLMVTGAHFFQKLWNAPIKRIAVENPIMCGHAKELIGIGDQTQVLQPWQYGHGEVKATCLWLKNLPPLTPTDIVGGREPRIHKMSPGKDRSDKRSVTYEGIAKAMASQWGALL